MVRELASRIKVWETYIPRGRGKNWGPCMVCGKESSNACSDLSAYVNGRTGGEHVVAMFKEVGLTARLDYRDFEPNYVQVKVCVCEAHKGHLDVLWCETRLDKVVHADILEAVRIGEGRTVPEWPYKERFYLERERHKLVEARNSMKSLQYKLPKIAREVEDATEALNRTIGKLYADIENLSFAKTNGPSEAN